MEGIYTSAMQLRGMHVTPAIRCAVHAQQLGPVRGPEYLTHTLVRYDVSSIPEVHCKYRAWTLGTLGTSGGRGTLPHLPCYQQRRANLVMVNPVANIFAPFLILIPATTSLLLF